MEFWDDGVDEPLGEWIPRIPFLYGNEVIFIFVAPSMTINPSEWKISHLRSLEPVAEKF